MFDLLFLVVPFKENFLMDVVFPGVALVFVLVLIANSILNKLGYTLW